MQAACVSVCVYMYTHTYMYVCVCTLIFIMTVTGLLFRVTRLSLWFFVRKGWEQNSNRYISDLELTRVLFSGKKKVNCYENESICACATEKSDASCVYACMFVYMYMCICNPRHTYIHTAHIHKCNSTADWVLSTYMYTLTLTLTQVYLQSNRGTCHMSVATNKESMYVCMWNDTIGKPIRALYAPLRHTICKNRGTCHMSVATNVCMHVKWHYM